MLRRNLPDVVLLVIFMLIIALPLTSPLPSPELFHDKAGSPQPDYSAARLVKAAIDFPPKFNAYFENHYLFHQQAVDALQSIRFHLFHESVFPNVLIGKDDWLYYTGENNIADFECTSPFTSQELQTIRRQLLDWNEQLLKRGVRFYIVIAPNKETIYPQYLPDQVKPGNKTCRIDQVMQELESTQLAVLDLRASLQASAEISQVYHRTDTHWNSEGAFLATRQILALLKEDFPQLTLPSSSGYQEQIKSFSGDLAAFLPSDSKFVEQEVSLIPVFQLLAQLKEGPVRSIVSTIPGSDLPAALVFRDSFTDALIPFLSEHFSRAVFVPSFAVDLDLVDKEKPDIVILELAQRYLTVLR